METENINTTIVIASGGFDPIHSGHIHYLNEAVKLGDYLAVGVNSDDWLIRKKGKAFLSWPERATIIKNLKAVNHVFDFDDTDGTAKDLIKIIRQHNPNSKIIFANGGDRTKENIPEMDIADDNLEFVFGVGGENKQNSSSWILKSWDQKN
jgi:D-beta-D-heptose 7-phosphate kinase/D-beta-D-heptose 1-phosphate adenosyltransferase